MTMSGRTRTALITGASAGIGAAFARVFAEQGFNLVLTARRLDRLEALATELSRRHGVSARAVAADLADPGAPAEIQARVGAAGIDIDALVNNAGYGLTGTFAETTWPQQADFIQVMVTAVAELSHRFLPGMIARRYGLIINVSSLAGLLPGTAGHTLYAASKSFLVRLSESLAFEGAPHGVNVTALCPGFTYSEFHDVNGTRDLVSKLPRWMWVDADFVARQGFDAVTRGRVVSVPTRVNRTIALLSRHLPPSLLRAVLKRQAGRYRRV
jgi:hypothetical protein